MTRPECLNKLAHSLTTAAESCEREGRYLLAVRLRTRATYYRHRATLEAQR